MKKNIFLLATLSFLTTLHVSAQYVNGIHLSELQEEYIQIDHGVGMAGRNIYVDLDYGQLKKAGEQGDQRIKNEDGNPLPFHSMVHAINYMRQFGYELFEVYSTGSGGDIYPKYILRKQKTE